MTKYHITHIIRTEH